MGTMLIHRMIHRVHGGRFRSRQFGTQLYFNGMRLVRHSHVLPSVLWRPALLLFAVAQLFVVIAPLAEGRFGADAKAHVEAAGSSGHHAHNEADCTSCVARSLVGAPNRSDNTAPLSLQRVHVQVLERVDSFGSRAESSSRPRAPPFRQA